MRTPPRKFLPKRTRPQRTFLTTMMRPPRKFPFSTR
jgi:hypothetical protein